MALIDQKSTIGNFWLKYESKIILILGFILVSVISFEAGALKSRDIKQNPVIIEKPAENQAVCQAVQGEAAGAQNLAQEAQSGQKGVNIPPQNCAYVGSKNSNKFHLPTCRWAKNIKPENLVCFKDAADAQVEGYLADKNCIKN